MKRLLVISALAVGVLASSACGAVTPYAATVNGQRISQRELDRELKEIRANKDYVEALEQGNFEVKGSGDNPRTFDSAFVARVLTRAIVLELVHQEVVRKKLAIAPKDLEAAKADVLAGFPEGTKMFDDFDKAYQDVLIERSAEVTVLQANLATAKVDADAIAAYYEEHKNEFNETCVSHILVDAKEAADGIKARLGAGEDFAAIAKAESKDPGSGPNGGSLDCVATGQLVPEFETAMAALEPGAVSDPVQTQFGWHLIKVTERKPKAIDEVQAQIREALLAGAQEPFNEFLENAIAKAKITVNPRYGKFDRSGGRAEVVPPPAPTTTTTETTIPFELPEGIPAPAPDDAPVGGGG